MRLVAVVLGAESGKERFDIARQMLEYGFANYSKYSVAVRGTRVRGVLPVTGGEAEGVPLALEGDLTLLVTRGDEQRIRLEPDLPDALPAPVAAGQRAGFVRVLADDRQVAQIPVVAAEAVPARRTGLTRILEHWPWVGETS